MTDPQRALAGAGATVASRPVLLARARHARQLRTRMAGLLPPDLFVDPAWDMMLELVIESEEGRQPCVKELIAASGESATTALRRLDRLQANGLITRTLDRRDHRRVLIALTEKGKAGMAGMLEHLFEPADPDAHPRRPPRSFQAEQERV
jgi:DNA-binding MarR family transcriptional regulator